MCSNLTLLQREILARLVITVLGMVADMELKFIRDRQRAGIDAAKRKGRVQGAARNRSMQRGSKSLRQREIPKAQIARDLNISRMTVYRALKDGDGSAA